MTESFWYIHAAYRSPEGQGCAFTWQRGHIFDHAIATILYETCVDEPLATITKARRCDPGYTTSAHPACNWRRARKMLCNAGEFCV